MMTSWRLLFSLASAIHLIDAEASIPMLLYKGTMSSKGEKLDLWKVPLPEGHVKGTDFVKVCQSWLMTPVCPVTTDETCIFADSHCVGLAVEGQAGCGVPLQGTVKLLGYATNTDPHLRNMCVYIAPGNGYDDGFLCGPEASYDGYGLGCNSGTGGRSVLCAGSTEMDSKLANESIQVQRDSEKVNHLRHRNAALRQVVTREQSENDGLQQKLTNESAHRSSAAAMHEHIHILHQELEADHAEINKVVFVAFAAILGVAYFICRRARSAEPLPPAKMPLLAAAAGQGVQAGTLFQPSVSTVEYDDREGHKVRCVRVVAPGRRVIDNGRSVKGSVKVEVAPDGCSTKVHLKLVKEADVPSFAVPVVRHGASDASGSWEKTLTFPDGTWQRLEPITSLGLDMHGILQVFLVRKLPPKEQEITIAAQPLPCQLFAIGSEAACSEAPASSVDWLEVANGAHGVIAVEGDGASSVGVSEALGEALKQGVP